MMSDHHILSTESIQDEIIQEFQTLAEDRESMLHYLIELGEKLPPLAAVHKTEQNRIKGCMSMVWLSYRQQNNQLFFEADSNTAITKGLMSLLLRVLSGQPIQTILATNLYFVEKIGMHQMIGSQRSSGLAHMVEQIRMVAVAHQTP